MNSPHLESFFAFGLAAFDGFLVIPSNESIAVSETVLKFDVAMIAILSKNDAQRFELTVLYALCLGLYSLADAALKKNSLPLARWNNRQELSDKDVGNHW